MLNRVDSPVHHLDRLIQYHKGGLQTRQLNQGLDCPTIDFSTPLDLLSTLPQSGQLEVVDVLFEYTLELRQEDTRHVLLSRPDPEPSVLHGLGDLVGDVAAGCVRDFGEGEGRDLHHPAHLALGFIDSLEDFWSMLELDTALRRTLLRTSEAPGNMSAVCSRGVPYGSTYFVRASLFLFSKLCPVSAPLSLFFI